jgi:LPS sulfotransferase NodH
MSQTRFVILAAPRTGSNLLCTLLNSHPDITCHHELFNPRGVFYAVDRRDGSIDLGDVGERDRDPIGFLDRLWHSDAKASCIGFKMTRGQSDDVMQQLLRDTEVRKILLRRGNRLKTYVSQLIAEQTDLWEAYTDADLCNDVSRPRIGLDGLRAHTASTDRFYADLLEATRGQPVVETMYEDLFSTSEQERLLRELGASTRASLRSGSVKQNDRDLRQLIDNFDELEIALRGSPHHAELHDTQH